MLDVLESALSAYVSGLALPWRTSEPVRLGDGFSLLMVLVHLRHSTDPHVVEPVSRCQWRSEKEGRITPRESNGLNSGGRGHQGHLLGGGGLRLSSLLGFVAVPLLCRCSVPATNVHSALSCPIRRHPCAVSE